MPCREWLAEVGHCNSRSFENFIQYLQFLYDMVNVLPNTCTHNRHPIAHSGGWGMGWHSLVLCMTYFFILLFLLYMQFLVLDQILTAWHGTHFFYLAYRFHAHISMFCHIFPIVSWLWCCLFSTKLLSIALLIYSCWYLGLKWFIDISLLYYFMDFITMTV